MKTKLKPIKIRELMKKYVDNAEEGVRGYSNRLNIRPSYQREFVYGEEEERKVIETVMNKHPLNSMFWGINKDGTFELMDGQQRTLSICRFVNGDFFIPTPTVVKLFDNLTKDEQNKFLNYELTIYLCAGPEKEKLDWIRTINIQGKKHTEQEIKNMSYTGEWLEDTKRHFSKTGCVAYNIGGDYVKGSPIRQEYLEKVLKWISDGNIEKYMAEHQQDKDASELWQYFQNVINWIKVLFTNYRKEMKSVDWGPLYNKFKNKNYNANKLEIEITKLMEDDDVTKKSGIYEYVLTRNEKHLNIRAFTTNQKREAYERQKEICPKCGKHFKIEKMEAHHIIPWHKGGKTISENCQMLCIECHHKIKSGK